MTETDLSFPIGRFTPPERMTDADRDAWIGELAEAPSRLRLSIDGLSARQLDTEYRPGGWNVRQVVHHVPDSHMNAYVRFKLALTEDAPLIHVYDEGLWAKLPDSRESPEISLALLDALHLRWVALLRSLSAEELRRPYRHPEMGVVPLSTALALYAWHGKHHTAHITKLRERMGW